MPVTSGARTLKDAMNEAMRDWVANVEDTFYLIGTVAGPHPYPAMVRDFQSVIGERGAGADAGGRGPAARRGWSPAIGGGSNAMGLFHPFLDDPSVRLIGVEAGGHGLETGEHAAILDRRPARRAARQPHLPAAGRRRPDHRGAFDLAPASTIPASGRRWRNPPLIMTAVHPEAWRADTVALAVGSTVAT